MALENFSTFIFSSTGSSTLLPTCLFKLTFLLKLSKKFFKSPPVFILKVIPRSPKASDAIELKKILE